MLSDDELVELGRCRPSNLHPWGIGTTREIFLTAARAIESAACAPLLSEIESLKLQLGAVITARDMLGQKWANSASRIAELEQQLAEARKDAEAGWSARAKQLLSVPMPEDAPTTSGGFRAAIKEQT